jgi:nucleotide-binding universal stress UspA family protein
MARRSRDPPGRAFRRSSNGALSVVKVLVATDFSPASPTIETVKARPWPTGTEVRVLHVVDLAPFEPSAELLETARRGAESVTEFLARDLRRSGLEARAEVLTAHPRTAIAEFARKWGADFILIGSHGVHGLARFLLGSTARAVVRGAPCSVEVVRPGVKGSSGWKILFATDGSDCATKAARSVAERPWAAGTTVRIASVVAPFMPITDAGTAYFEASQAREVAPLIEAEMRSQAVEAVLQSTEIVRQAGVARVETMEPTSGDPKRVIIEEASKWGATMIVVGSRGRHGLDRLLMGSVSEFVAMHAHCSVEVIR